MRTSLSILLLFAALGAAPVAAAGPASQGSQARALYESGVAHFNRGEWGDAITDLKQCYGLTHQPILLFDIAQAYRQTGADDIALQYYRQFLAEAGPQDPTRPQAQALEAELERMLGVAPSGPSRGPQPAPPTGVSSPPRVATHLPASQPAAGSPVPVQVQASSSQPIPVVVVAPRERPSLVPAIVAGAVSVGLLAGGGVFAYLGSQANDRLHTVSPGDSPTAKDADLSTARTDAWIADGLFAGAALGAAITTYLYVADDRERERPVSVAFSPSGGMLTITGTWGMP